MTPPASSPEARAGAPAAQEMRDITMQRVRVGVTGLAAVFLLTLLAAALLGLLAPHHKAAHAAGNISNAQAGDAPKEPLAELGVAPGNVPQTPAARTAAPAARPPAIAPSAPPPDTVPVPTVDLSKSRQPIPAPRR